MIIAAPVYEHVFVVCDQLRIVVSTRKWFHPTSLHHHLFYVGFHRLINMKLQPFDRMLIFTFGLPNIDTPGTNLYQIVVGCYSRKSLLSLLLGLERHFSQSTEQVVAEF